MRAFLLLLLAAHAAALPLPADDTNTWLLAEVRFYPECVKTIKQCFFSLAVQFNLGLLSTIYQLSISVFCFFLVYFILDVYNFY